jgi:phosphate transport system substrate-binding protein
MSSRPIKDEEAEALKAAGLGDLRSMACSFPIALDGVAIIVNPAVSGVQQLTVDQISRIFGGEITDWSEVGGTPANITIYARDEQSGTFDTFKGKVLKPYHRSLAKIASRFEDSQELVRKLAGDPHGIGFVGLPYVDSTVGLVAVQASADARSLSATRLTVKSLDYPLARLLYMYAPVERSRLASDFLSFCLTEEGQAIADATGFVGQGAARESDLQEAAAHKQKLLDDPSVPMVYKSWIEHHNRNESAANIRFDSARPLPDINSTINIHRMAARIALGGKAPAEILLIGFADNVGSDAANLKLARARAETVAQSLGRLGLANIRVEAMGEAMPIADNSTEEGKSANRRVEIWIQP